MNSIYIVEVGEVKGLDWEKLGQNLERIFGLRVKKIGPVDLPDFAFNSEKKQYDASKILQDISGITFDDLEKSLAITNKDLFVEGYNYIFGQGDNPGRLSIVSSFRLDPKNYEENFNKDLFNERLLKEAIHELGHNFGLPHCPEKSCPMHFSNNVTDTDFKKVELCEKCGNLLKMTK